MLGDALLAAAGFAVMEPVSYAAHRWLMHGVGWVLHRSHHRSVAHPGDAGWWEQVEANDAFPVIFAAATVLGVAAGTTVPALSLLVPVAVGVTAYGAAYAFVHDIYIHHRFFRLPTIGPLERLRQAHGLHHRFGGEPYGMLCPIVPRTMPAATAALRHRGTRTREDQTS